MQRNHAEFYVNDIELFKVQMLNWANQFSICCFMDSHHYEDAYHTYDCLLATETLQVFNHEKNNFDQLDAFYNNCNDWIFGHLNYDLKNEIENLESNHKNKISFPDIFLFQPKTVITLNGNTVEVFTYNSPDLIFNDINCVQIVEHDMPTSIKEIKAAISKNEYIETIEKLKAHILHGDCYEINFCQEFFIKNVEINALQIFSKLLEISPSPFSCYYKLYDNYLLCASPERYLSKHKQKIVEQPIKGTSARNINDDADAFNKHELYYNPKERSENVMVVDLVRNDLSKICEQGSVITDELFGIYTFPQVHQMISTISGTLKEGINFSEIIKATFPMGSMTGAPKYRVMQLIEQYEKTRRGLFSGSVGYITPQKDFDFNVVIRSIFYNQTKKYLNYLVGSAITIYADEEKEYDECMVKVAAIKKVLTA